MNKHTLTNEKAYRSTKSWLKKFNKSKQELAKLPESIEQPWLRTAQRNSLQHLIDHLQEEAEEYEALKSGKIKVPQIDNLRAMPELLIKKRIANGWTQVEMAKRLGMHYQQLQRYESTDYESVTLSTLREIIDVLNRSSSSKKPRKAAAYKLKTDKRQKRSVNS